MGEGGLGREGWVESSGSLGLVGGRWRQVGWVLWVEGPFSVFVVGFGRVERGVGRWSSRC